MRRFSIRVVLHNATWQDYVTLAAKLAKQRVVDVIRSDNGIWYKLPPAEYNFEGDLTAEQVNSAVVATAAQVSRSYEVVVTEAAQRVWFGLQRLQVAANS